MRCADDIEAVNAAALADAAGASGPASAETWLAALARSHTPALAALARREGLGPEDALDAVQEAFAVALARTQDARHAPELTRLETAPDEALAYLAHLTRNAARNMRRRHHRARPHFPIVEAQAADAAALSVDQALVRAEDEARASGCVRQLDELRRRVVNLRVVQALSGLEVAQRLGLTPGHVAVVLHRAKVDLLRCMHAPL
ncbi:MAG: sigma-70 family RNA polymerase sigma factor [Myxococcota bacterium]